jgi:hypothetical protein
VRGAARRARAAVRHGLGQGGYPLAGGGGLAKGKK